MSTTTQPQSDRPSPWTRAAFALALGSLASLGCDSQDPEAECLPSQGCDGVQDVEEIEPDDVEAIHSGMVSVYPGHADAPTAARDDAEFKLPLPVEPVPPAACLVHPDDQANVTVVAHDPEVCVSISVDCAEGWIHLEPECGCGCRYIGDDEAEPLDSAQLPRPIPTD